MTDRARLRPRTHAALALVGVALVALGARVAVPLPLSPVPVSLQTLFVALVALVLPWRASLGAMALYLALGALGLPVFADGKRGLDALLGPTGGFLVGFLVAAPLASVAVSRSPRRWTVDLAAALALHLVVLAVGVGWLTLATPRTLRQAIDVGALPFVPGAVAKSVLAVGLAALWRRRAER